MDQRWGWDVTFINVVRCRVININLRPNWNKLICKCLVNWKKYIFSAATIERLRNDWWQYFVGRENVSVGLELWVSGLQP